MSQCPFGARVIQSPPRSAHERPQSRTRQSGSSWSRRAAGCASGFQPGKPPARTSRRRVFAAEHADRLEADRSRLRPALDEITERECFACLGQRPGMFVGKTSFHMLSAFPTGYDQHALRQGGNGITGWHDWYHLAEGRRQRLPWPPASGASSPRSVPPELSRRDTRLPQQIRDAPVGSLTKKRSGSGGGSHRMMTCCWDQEGEAQCECRVGERWQPGSRTSSPISIPTPHPSDLGVCRALPSPDASGRWPRWNPFQAIHRM